MIFLGSFGPPEAGKMRERASGLPFFDPGRKDSDVFFIFNVKLNLENRRHQRAWQELRRLQCECIQGSYDQSIPGMEL